MLLAKNTQANSITTSTGALKKKGDDAVESPNALLLDATTRRNDDVSRPSLFFLTLSVKLFRPLSLSLSMRIGEKWK